MSTDTQEQEVEVAPKAAKTTKKSAPAKAKEKSTGETSHDKFRRLAPPRVESALKKIGLVGNLAGSGYHHEPNEGKEVVQALTEAVEEVAQKFKGGKGKRGFSFRG
jgi:hypothetical protein